MAGNRCLVIISAAIPQSSSARGSSKPLPYGVKIGFGEDNKFCGKMLRAQCLFCALYISSTVGRGLSPVAFVGDFMAGNRFFAII